MLRPARLLTEAELDVLSPPGAEDAIRRSIADLEPGRTRPGSRRRGEA